MNEKYSKKTAAAVCKRILKEAKKGPRPILHGSWKDKAGNQCFCDGFRAYRLAEPLPDMPELDTDKLQPMNLDLVFKPLQAGAVVEIDAPDMDAVKAFISEHDPRKPANIHKYTAFDLGEDKPDMNPFYIQEVLRLFPGGKWYMDPDPLGRLQKPVFVVHEKGSACLCPVHNAQKIKRVKEAREQAESKPAQEPAAPAERPETVSEPAPISGEFKYFIYARLPGDKSFSLADPAGGKYKLGKFYAPRFREHQLEKLKEFVDLAAATIPGSAFQIRRIDGKRIVYNAVPTYSPELFIEQYAA